MNVEKIIDVLTIVARCIKAAGKLIGKISGKKPPKKEEVPKDTE
ncbi:hypothetical protein [Parabacteroides bouchesdurhonensis]|nr:hypothetical protein [Parabacteroides bouchesdurhonensis]